MVEELTFQKLARYQTERRARRESQRLRLKYKRKRSNKRRRWILLMLEISYHCGGNLLRKPDSNVDIDLFEFPIAD